MAADETQGLRLERGQGCALFGLVAAGFAIFIIPLVLGPLGMILGAAAYVRGERRGRWVIAAAVLGMVLGILLGLLPDHFVTS